MQVKISATARHGIPFTVEVYVDFGDRTTATVLAFIVEPLTLAFPEGFLLLIEELRVSIQADSPTVLVAAHCRIYLEETFLGVKRRRHLLRRVFFNDDRVELL